MIVSTDLKSKHVLPNLPGDFTFSPLFFGEKILQNYCHLDQKPSSMWEKHGGDNQSRLPPSQSF